MNRRVKLLILLLCTLCVISVSVMTAYANDTETHEGIPTNLHVFASTNSKTEYNAGEYFEPETFRGLVTCIGSPSYWVTFPTLEYEQTGPLTASDTYITFYYQGLTYNLPITVTGTYRQPIGIDVSTTKTDYLALEKIDPSTFSANLIYADGTIEPISPELCSFYPSLDTFLSSGNNSVTVSYSVNGIEYSETLPIFVTSVVSIEVSGNENLSLYEGSVPAAPAGLTVTAYYDAAKTISQTITEFDVSYDFEAIKANENGKTTISILLDSESFDIEVNVIPIVSYNITGLKSAYYYGDTLSFDNVRVYATYSDGITVNVTSEVEFSGPETIVHGSEITAFHNGFDLKNFLKSYFPEGKITIINAPNKLKYEIGEVFDSTGLSVAIEYSDGSRNLLDRTQYTFTTSYPLTAADKFVVIEYLGCKTNISISVGDEAYIVSLNIIGSPDVMNYYEGSVLNTSGLNIEAYLSDGTKTIVTPEMLTFTPALGTPLTPDVIEVKISANDGTDKYCEVSFPITVIKKVPTILIATSLPNKLQYAEGEIFDPDGLALSLLFNDNTSIVPSIFSFSPELGTSIVLHTNAPEKCIIYAVYEYEGTEFTYPIEITVTPAEVDNLLVSRSPAKTVYEIGESFDPTGLELILIYKDSTLKYPKVPDGYYTYSPSVITAETKEIAISFRGLTVTVPITVNGVDSSEVTTSPIEPPITTEPIGPETSEPNVTTEDPNASTDTEITTEESSDTTTPEDTPGSTDVTTDPVEITTEGDSTTEDNSGGGKSNPSSMLYLWIIIIVIIIAALIALIIYYKKNFT